MQYNPFFPYRLRGGEGEAEGEAETETEGEGEGEAEEEEERMSLKSRTSVPQGRQQVCECY